MNSAKVKHSLIAILSFSCLMPIQICFAALVVGNPDATIAGVILTFILAYLLLIFSFTLEKFLDLRNYHYYFFNSTKNAHTLSFSDLKIFAKALQEKKELLGKATAVFTKENISTLIDEVKRNDSFSYINNGTLNEKYISLLEKSISDSSVYIVLSDTGSVPSQFISLFTSKDYNHISIAFDSELHTLVSYNGGERVNPPGLNREMLSFFSKKENAVIYVYSLPVTREQKQKMIDKVIEINENGSAYNLLGLVLKKSYKPNIMHCSQFVYTLLEYADANYFVRNKHDIKPTDLIELDYHKKLKFEYEVRFK